MSKIKAIRKSIETGKPINNGMHRIHILNQGRCVNSKWVASWIAKSGQECCECGFKCKVRIIIHNYEYVVDKLELYELLPYQHVKPEPKSNT